MGSRKLESLCREEKRMEKETQVKESQPNTGQVGCQYSPWTCLLSKYCWPKGEMGEVEWVIGAAQLNPRNTFLPSSQTRLAHMQWSQQTANWEMQKPLWGERRLQNSAQLCQKSSFKGRHTSSLVYKEQHLEQVEKAPASSSWSCCCPEWLFLPRSPETSAFLRLFQLQNQVKSPSDCNCTDILLTYLQGLAWVSRRVSLQKRHESSSFAKFQCLMTSWTPPASPKCQSTQHSLEQLSQRAHPKFPVLPSSHSL